MSSFTEATLDPANTVFFVVDVQNEFYTPGGLRYAAGMERIIRPLVFTIARARKHGIPIVFTHSVRTQHEAGVTAFGADRYLHEGTWNTALVDALLPRDGDIFIYKHSHNVWWETDLEERLSPLVEDPRNTNVLLAGGAARACVHRAIMGFHVRDYWAFPMMDLIDDDAWARHQYLSPEYYNVLPTRSDLVSFAPTTHLTGR